MRKHCQVDFPERRFLGLKIWLWLYVEESYAIVTGKVCLKISGLRIQPTIGSKPCFGSRIGFNYRRAYEFTQIKSSILSL